MARSFALSGCVRWGIAVVVAAAGLPASGCETVEPWERGKFAHDCMQVPVDETEAAYRSHLQVVREGSTGSVSAGGGGCGCN